MSTTHTHTERPTSSGQGGFTMVESCIAGVLFAGMLAATFTTMLSVSNARQASTAEFKQEGSYREALDFMCKELSQSTFENNPVNNQPRFSILQNATSTRKLQELQGVKRKTRVKVPTGSLTTTTVANQTLTFQTLAGATQSGLEVTPTWSTNITYALNGQGQILRTQDGTTRVLASGIKNLAFERTNSDRFRVTLTAHWKDPNSGQIKEISHSKVTRPWN